MTATVLRTFELRTGRLTLGVDEHSEFTMVELPGQLVLGPNRPRPGDPEPWWAHDAMHLFLAERMGWATSLALHRAASPAPSPPSWDLTCQLAREERTVTMLLDLRRPLAGLA